MATPIAAGADARADVTTSTPAPAANDPGRSAGGRFRPGHAPANRIDFSDAKREETRFRFEETGDSKAAIARDAAISVATLDRMAEANGWMRRKPPMRDLSSAEALAAETRQLRQAAEKEPPPDLEALVDDLVRRLQRRIAAHDEGMTLTYREQQRANHDLVSLKAAAQDLMSLRAQQKDPTHVAADNRPTDIDAFRDELARRIRAFVASRRGSGGGAAGNPADGVDEVQ